MRAACIVCGCANRRSEGDGVFSEAEADRSGAKVVHVSGTVQREAGGKDTQFGIWVEEGNRRPIPLRIEYQAKSYLRLTFEAES
jgi:hypothetical protein